MPRATIALLCLALAVRSAPAQMLAPGNPAGIQAAQYISYRTGFIGISIIAVALTCGLPSSGTSTASTATTS
jgi:hypothetical protein